MTTHPPDPAAPRSAGEPVEVGRALDIEVAEKVFDQIVCWTEADIPDGWRLDDGQTLPGYRDGTFVYSLPHYSTDIAAAWLVLEHVRELGNARGMQGFRVESNRRWGPSGAVYWQAGYIVVGDDGGDEWHWAVTAEADTAPEAICRAALQSRLR